MGSCVSPVEFEKTIHAEPWPPNPKLRPLVPPGRALRARLRRAHVRHRLRRRDGGRARALRELHPRPQRARRAGDPAGAGARRAAADRGRAQGARACARSYAQGLRITDEQALHGGQARRRQCCASRSRRCFRRACRTRRWRARRSASPPATTSPRGRSACARASISSSPARCARWTRPRIAGASRRRRHRAGAAPRLLADRRSVQPRVGRRRRERRRGPQGRQAAHVYRQAADRPQGRSGVRAHRRRGRWRCAAKKGNLTPAAMRAIEHARARGGQPAWRAATW